MVSTPQEERKSNGCGFQPEVNLSNFPSNSRKPLNQVFFGSHATWLLQTSMKKSSKHSSFQHLLHVGVSNQVSSYFSIIIIIITEHATVFWSKHLIFCQRESPQGHWHLYIPLFKKMYLLRDAPSPGPLQISSFQGALKFSASTANQTVRTSQWSVNGAASNTRSWVIWEGKR